MPTWIWIVIAVVVVLALALVLGTVRARGRRISLKDAPPPQVTPADGPPAKGGYKAGGSISFASGTATAPPPTKPMPVVPVDEGPLVGEDTAVPRDSPSRSIVEVPLPETQPEAEPEPVVEELEAPPALEEIAPTAGRLSKLRGRLSR